MVATNPREGSGMRRRARIVPLLVAALVTSLAFVAPPEPAHARGPSDPWRDAPNMSVARRQHSATLLGSGNVLVAGGQTAVDENGNPTNMTYFRECNVLVSIRGNRALVLGLFDDSTINRASAEIFESASGTWSLAADNLIARSALSGPTRTRVWDPPRVGAQSPPPG